MNQTNKHYKTYRLIAMLFVVILSLGLTITAMAYTWAEPPDAAPGAQVTLHGDNRDNIGYMPGDPVHVDVKNTDTGWTTSFDTMVFEDPNVSEFPYWVYTITLSEDPFWAVGSYTYTATFGTQGLYEVGYFTDSPLAIIPIGAMVPAGGEYTFTYSGGDNKKPYVFSLFQDQSGATIDPNTGKYTAGTTGSGTDIIDGVRVTNDGVSADAYVFVGDMGNGETLLNGCMKDVAGFGLNCTANDVGIAEATNINITDPCTNPGDMVSFSADFKVLLTAQARYDIGIYFATDGDPNHDGAQTGSCSISTVPYSPNSPWLDLDGTTNPFPGGNKASGVQDTCGDIDNAHNPLYPNVTLTLVCLDEDGNGKLDLPYCTSWREPGANDLCTSPLNAFPGAPSKCECNPGFSVPIPVPGQIIVDKVTSPSGSDQVFDFNLTGIFPAPIPEIPAGEVDIDFSLKDQDPPWESESLWAGTYKVVEVVDTYPSGWDKTKVECTSSKNYSVPDPENITLHSGEIITCTFTNTQRGKIIVEKQTDPDGDAGSFTFTGDAAGTISDNGQIVVSNLVPGTYYSTEADPGPNFSLSSIVCDDTNSSNDKTTRMATFKLEAGETVKCTFTNTHKTGSLQIKKDVVPDNTATNWDFAVTGPTSYNCSIAGDGSCDAKTVLTGSYSIVETAGLETNLDDYTTTWACTIDGVNGSSGTGTTISSLTIDEDDVVICTFTNTLNFQNAYVTACKEDTDGNKLSGWDISLDGVTQATEDDGCTTFEITESGDYYLSETLKDGWTLVDPASNSFLVEISENGGEDLGPYTFKNFEWADITACKYDTSGNKLAGWTMNLAGPDAQTGDTGTNGCVTFTVKKPGDYKVSETLKDGWTQISPVGNNYDVTVATNGSYDFTFTNFQYATITACKVDTDGKKLSGWDIKLNGSTQTTGDDGCTTFTVKQPGDYTVSEVLKDGWTNISPLSYPVTVKTGGSYDFTFTNFQWASVKACKERFGTGEALSGWTINLLKDNSEIAQGITAINGSGDACVSFTIKNPGSYSLTEDLQAGWIKMSPSTPSFDFMPSSGYEATFVFVNAMPSIFIEKKTAAYGMEGDGIVVFPGDLVTWNYYLENTGDVDLTNVVVTDNNGTPDFPGDDFTVCTIALLLVDGKASCSMTVTNNVPAGSWYHNIGDVVGTWTEGSGNTGTVTDNDPSSYYSTYPGNVTDSQLCDFGSQFRLLFTPDMSKWTPSTPWYKLSDSNPGQFFYNLMQTNSTGVDWYKLEIPYPFVTQGAMPVHVYDGLVAGVDGSYNCFYPGNTLAAYDSIITLSSYTDTNGDGKVGFGDVVIVSVPARSGFQYINIHLDYGLEKLKDWWKNGSSAVHNTNPTVTIKDNQAHTFKAYADATLIPASSDTIYNINEFKPVRGIGGFGQYKKMVEGVPVYFGIPNAVIKLYQGTKLLESMTNDVDGWYLSTTIAGGKLQQYKVVLQAGVLPDGTPYASQTKYVSIGGKVKYGQVDFLIP